MSISKYFKTVNKMKRKIIHFSIIGLLISLPVGCNLNTGYRIIFDPNFPQKEVVEGNSGTIQKKFVDMNTYYLEVDGTTYPVTKQTYKTKEVGEYVKFKDHKVVTDDHTFLLFMFILFCIGLIIGTFILIAEYSKYYFYWVNGDDHRY